MYAKHALAKFNMYDMDLPVGNDRSPIWPLGFIGSITHVRDASEGFCAAAVARSTDFIGLGVDTEFATGLAPVAWPVILTPAELSQMRALSPPQRQSEVLRRWSAKEALVKAARIPFEPSTIETTELNPGEYAISHELSTESWHARTVVWNGLVCAAVVIARR
jgi:4'-phosphopantetheinyl transferase EntD